MQTQTSNTLYNAIMEADSKDRPPMLAPADSKDRPPMLAPDKEVPISEGSPVTTTERYMETYKNVSQDIRDQLNAEAEAVQIIFTGIDNDIYSTVDACSNAYEMWKVIERLKQEPSMVADDDKMSKDKEIDKLMDLIFLSFKKIYKPTNNNLQTSSNTSRANQDNSLRINKSIGYENQRIGNVTRARETVGSMVVQKYRIQCYNCKAFGHVVRECQKPKRVKDAAYHREKMLLYAADSGPIFDSEPVQKVSNDDHYNVFAIKSEHLEQSESVHDIYPIEQDAHNMIIDSLDMSYDREQIDQIDDDNDLANERELLASLIKKLKCEIDDSKNRNKFLETSNKVLIEQLKVQTMNMLNNKCQKSFAKPEFLKKAQRVNPRLYDIGCYNDNLALMLAPESDEVIRLEKES
nr:hypothetical protein [Tanacetum cinerariifolium]GEZ10661.1 hypothetical protein [Tanacetum cinerariifolium]